MEMCFYLSPICTISYSDNVFNKINIISAAAGLGGININNEYFHVRGRVIFGDVLLFILNLAQFSFVREKKKEKKENEKEKKKKENRLWQRNTVILSATHIF